MARRLEAISRHVVGAGPVAAVQAVALTSAKLHPILGAEVSLDLRDLLVLPAGPARDELIAELNRIWAVEGNGVMVFKRQHLSEAELKQFAALFGHVMAHPFQNNTNAHHQKNNAAVREVGNEDVPYEVMTVRDRSDTWHTDMTWMEHPPRATFLQCVERGPEMETGGEGGGTRGDTLIASMTNAFDSLSPALQQMLTGMTARHGVQDLMNSYGEEPDPERTYPNGVVQTRTENEHPCVIRHPVSGRPSMYVNNWPCKRFAGMTMEETAPLKRHLNSVATREANVYRHSWAEGDLVCMDQRVTMHMVMSDYDVDACTRVMQRTTITDTGDAPGCTHTPRPVGMSQLIGPEMSTVADRGGSPTSYRENPTMLPGSYTRDGAQPFSDRESARVARNGERFG